MSRRSFLRKYSYLSRILLACLLIFCITALFLGYLLFDRTYDEIRARNEEHYKESAHMLSLEFTEKTEAFKQHASAFIYHNTDTDRRILLQTLKQNPYYYYEAARTLREYGATLADGESLMIAYVEDDIILTEASKYTIAEFAAFNHIDLSDGAFLSFLSADDSRMKVYSTFPSKSLFQRGIYEAAWAEPQLYCAFPIALNGTKCTLIYGINAAGFANTAFIDQYADAAYCIYSDNGGLLFAGTDAFAEVPDEALGSFLADRSRDSIELGDDTYYKTGNALYDIHFVVKFPTSVLLGGLEPFFSTIRSSFILIVAALFIMLMLTAYISYKPIHELMKNIGGTDADRAGGEIGTILDAFGEIEGTVAEQKELLLEYLLMNLLGGIPIPREELAHYPEFFDAAQFLVCTVTGLRLDSAKRAALRSEIRTRCGAVIYVVEILHKNQTALIAVTEPCAADAETDIDPAEVVDSISAYIRETFGAAFKVGAGEPVSRYTELPESYLNSLTSLESVTTLPAEEAHALSSIEDFAAENTALFLEYVKNGDCDGALRVLSVIGAYIETEIRTAIYQRYIIYNFLTEYMKLIRSMGLPADIVNTTELLSYTDVRAMFDALGVNVKSVCARINTLNLNVYDTLRRDVLEYVNQNFTDPNLCRNQIADHFGISVYSLSRIFKESIDVGFKEYVNAKRLTLSKTMLLTTADSIAQIAAKVGFTNADYFTKLFRSTFDMTPSRYRELHKDV